MVKRETCLGICLLIVTVFVSCERGTKEESEFHFPVVIDTFYTGQHIKKYMPLKIYEYGGHYEYFGPIKDTIYASRSIPPPPKKSYRDSIELQPLLDRLYESWHNTRSQRYIPYKQKDSLIGADSSGLKLLIDNSQKISNRYPAFLYNPYSDDTLSDDSVIFSEDYYVFGMHFYALDSTNRWNRIHKVGERLCGTFWSYGLMPDGYCLMVYSPKCEGSFQTKMKAFAGNQWSTVESNEIDVSIDPALFTGDYW